MTHEKHIIIKANEQRKSKKRLHSLSELAKKVAKHEQELAAKAKLIASLPVKKKRPLRKRKSFWLATFILLPVIILGSFALYITSPMAEQRFTSWVVSGVNYLGKPLELKVHIGLVRGFLSGAIKLYDVRIQDKHGPWLYVEEGTMHLRWGSVFKAIIAVLQYQGTGTVASYLYSDNPPISEQYKKENIYRKDASSVYAHKDSRGHASDIEVFEKNKQNPNNEVILPAADNSQLRTVPALTVKYDPTVLNNLLEPPQVLKDKVVIGIEVGTLLGVRMPRLPRYLESEVKEDEQQSEAISFMPPWCAIDVGEFELANFQLGPAGRDIFISARFQVQANANQMRLRSTFLAEKTNSGQWVLPYTQDLPSDVTLSTRELQEKNNMAMTNMRDSAKDFFAEKKFLGFFSFDYNKGEADFRVQWRDTLLSPIFLDGLDGFWTRFRILTNTSVWPPTKENPLQAQMVSRFGGSFSEGKSRLRASLASAQLYWDGERFVLRDLNVISPIKKTNITVKGGMGVDPVHSFGTQLKISIEDISIIANLFDVNLQQSPVGGKLSLDAYITRGGKHLLWWTKPLPTMHVERAMPGLIVSPYDFSILAKDISTSVKLIRKSISNLHDYAANPPKPKETRLPPESPAEDAMQMRVKIASPNLQLPSGNVKDVFISFNAKSADALKVPASTAFKDKDSAKLAQEQGRTATNHIDFTAKGMPRGLVGSSFSRVGDVHGFGSGDMKFNWFLGGMHKESRVFQLEFENFILNLPGIKSAADIGFAYALPIVKRNWPWIDGKVSLDVDSWRWIGLVTGSNVRGSRVDLDSELRSFLDADKIPRQYLNAQVKADRFDSTQFIVRNVYGAVESKNLHDLADILALSTGNLREALKKEVSYTAPVGTTLLQSKLQLGAGRSGGFEWDMGDFNLNVIDENAKFTVKMHGDLSAILNGTYNFRKRVVSLKEMQFINR